MCLFISMYSYYTCTIACIFPFLPFRQIPMELIHAAQGGEVDINLEDRRNEVYVKPKPKVVAFSGEGHKLGK